MNAIRTTETVGRIAATHPAALRVFRRHGIDFCCGGERSLAQACSVGGLDADTVAREIAAVEGSTPDTEARWDEAPIGDLLDHILARFHAPLPVVLEDLMELSGTVLRVHGPKHIEAFTSLDQHLRTLAVELLQHLAQEEDVVFPWLRGPDAAAAAEAVAALEHDHVAVGRLLELLGADVETCSRDAECATWQALADGVARLERDTHVHVHLENNVLFPRVLRG